MVRELLIALLVMLVFLFAGEKILAFLSLRAETVSISGGIILFLIAIKMIFPSASGNSSGLPAGEAIYRAVGNSVSRRADYSRHADVVVSPVPESDGTSGDCSAAGLGRHLCHPAASLRYFTSAGRKGVNALERLMGLILVMMATQMFLDGIRMWMKG